MSGTLAYTLTVQEIRQARLHLTIPIAYEFASQILGDEDRAAELVADVLKAGHDAGGPNSPAYLQGWVLNQLYRRVIRIRASTNATPDPTNALSILSPESRAAVVAHDVMGLDNSASALAIGASTRKFRTILHTARVAMRDYLTGLGLV